MVILSKLSGQTTNWISKPKQEEFRNAYQRVRELRTLYVGSSCLQQIRVAHARPETVTGANSGGTTIPLFYSRIDASQRH